MTVLLDPDVSAIFSGSFSFTISVEDESVDVIVCVCAVVSEDELDIPSEEGKRSG